MTLPLARSLLFSVSPLIMCNACVMVGTELRSLSCVCSRALQLPDTAVQSYFLTAFGRPVREQTQESARSSVPTITQALHIINGDTLNNKLRAKGNVIDQLIKAGEPDAQIVQYLYLAALSRYPTAAEKQELVSHLRTAEMQKVQDVANPRRAALSDLAWAMLTSKEFMFDH